MQTGGQLLPILNLWRMNRLITCSNQPIHGDLQLQMNCQFKKHERKLHLEFGNEKSKKMTLHRHSISHCKHVLDFEELSKRLRIW